MFPRPGSVLSPYSGRDEEVELATPPRKVRRVLFECSPALLDRDLCTDEELDVRDGVEVDIGSLGCKAVVRVPRFTVRASLDTLLRNVIYLLCSLRVRLCSPGDVFVSRQGGFCTKYLLTLCERNVCVVAVDVFCGVDVCESSPLLKLEFSISRRPNVWVRSSNGAGFGLPARSLFLVLLLRSAM